MRAGDRNMNDELEKIRKYWNFRAEGFNDSDIPSEKTNAFLRGLKERGMLCGGRSIDIGCGTGSYTAALAEYFDFVLGVDISDEMIAYARKRKADNAIKNIGFRLGSWQEADIAQNGWEKSFDLAVAHMSPAVDSVETLEKMRSVSKKFCAVTKTVSRKSPIRGRVAEICGLKEDNCGRREMLAILDYLWQNGITPEIFYEKEVWTSELTAERAAEGYIRTLSLDGGIKDGAVEEIKRYFESIAENGMIRENTDVIICTVYWSEK